MGGDRRTDYRYLSLAAFDPQAQGPSLLQPPAVCIKIFPLFQLPTLVIKTNLGWVPTPPVSWQAPAPVSFIMVNSITLTTPSADAFLCIQHSIAQNHPEIAKPEAPNMTYLEVLCSQQAHIKMCPTDPSVINGKWISDA